MLVWYNTSSISDLTLTKDGNPFWFQEKLWDAIQAAPHVTKVEGRLISQRNKVRDKILHNVFGRDVLSQLKDEEEDALRAMLMLLFEAIQQYPSDSAYTTFHEGLRTRLIRWILFMDENMEGQAHISVVRTYYAKTRTVLLKLVRRQCNKRLHSC